MKCNYRNCGKELVDKRSDAKFCNKKCKDNERTYIKRELKRIKNDREDIKNKLKEIENLEIIKLFENIYKN